MSSRTDFLNCEANIDDTLNFFKDWTNEKELSSIRGDALRAIGNKAKSISKKSYNTFFHKTKSSTLYNSIKARTSKDKFYEIVEAKARANESQNWHGGPTSNGYVFYGYLQARGGTIVPKEEAYLTFKTPDGKWHKVVEARHTPHDFLSGPIESFMKTNEPSEIANKTIAKSLKKLAKKYNVEITE